ncbi:MAG: serine/threonine protein phosphatase 1 [Mucilaginibacter sp.]|nr:serine/threonine protein phosphatase 1 [Mucilaginibacter sp.]
MSDFIIGDIHGSISSLKHLLAALTFGQKDRLIFLGDYIDRGEDSKAVLELLMALERTHECVFLRGNHEDMCLAWAEDREHEEGIWLYNGGIKTLRDLGQHWIPAPYLRWMERTYLFHETPTHIYVHAGLPSRPSWDMATSLEYCWIREPFLSSEYDWGKTVVFGHTIQHGAPLVLANKIGIDTGSFLPGGLLTCLVLPENRFVSANCRGVIREVRP